jgi:Ca2+-binding EF-hand superfamily protein
MDANADGYLEVDDIQLALKQYTKSASSRQEADSMIRLFDSAGEGKLSKHDWMALLES